MVEHHGFADFRFHRVVANQRAFAFAENDVGRDEFVHHFLVISEGGGRVVVAFVFAVFVFRDVVILLADVEGLVVVQLVAVLVLDAVFRNDEDCAVHAVYQVPRNHRAAWCAVVDEDARFGCLEAQHDFLSRCDVRQVAAAKRAGGGVEVNVVDELVFAVVFQGELNVIAFVDDNHRPRHGVVEGKRPHEHARLNFDFFFVDGHFHFDDARFGGRF